MILFDPKSETVQLFFDHPLPEMKEMVLLIEYEGTIQKDMAGFYRSVYTDAEGNEHWLAATQFESTAARLAFPCFDEPDMKARFVIKLIYKDTGSMAALSNMPEVCESTNTPIYELTGRRVTEMSSRGSPT